MNILFPQIKIPISQAPLADKSRNSRSLSFGSWSDIFLPSKRLQSCRNVEKFLKTVKKVTPDDYKKLSSEQLQDFFYYYNLDDNLQVAVEENLAVALPLKKFLDKKYGKDKYVFVSIGTSPAPLGRVIEFSGVETKYLPMSDLMYADKYQDIVKSAGFEDYEKFLKEQGISKKNLNLFKDLMIHHLNLPEDKMDFRSLNEDILYCCSQSKKHLHPFKRKISNSDFANNYITRFLSNSKAEYYGGIGHLSYKDLSKIAEDKFYADDTSKAYNLYVMHRLEEMGILKNNPKNRKSL